jgi:hypothetical protein
MGGTRPHTAFGRKMRRALLAMRPARNGAVCGTGGRCAPQKRQSESKGGQAVVCRKMHSPGVNAGRGRGARLAAARGAAAADEGPGLPRRCGATTHAALGEGTKRRCPRPLAGLRRRRRRAALPAQQHPPAQAPPLHALRGCSLAATSGGRWSSSPGSQLKSGGSGLPLGRRAAGSRSSSKNGWHIASCAA